MSGPNREVVTVILAGGQGKGLSSLTQKRTVASVPFGGKYRIIDFTLSNCVNSGLYNLLVLTQYRPLSLHDHIGNGKPWDLDRLHGGVRLVSPYIGRQQDKTAGGWDRGTADAVYQNLTELVEQSADNVLILGGDHVYKMDYRPMLDFHLDNEADVTVGILRVPIAEAHRFGIVMTDASGRITGFEEKPAQPKDNLVSMGIYFFNRDVLIDELVADSDDPNSQHDFGRNIIPRMLQENARVYAYNFEGYWHDVGTIQAYWEAHMELLDNPNALDLYDRDWVIYTRSEERPPATVGSGANVERSLISHGCQIKGQVIHSVLSPGVIVEEGAIVRDSVIMVNTVIGKGAVVDRAVIDKEVIIGANSQVGVGEATTPNKKEPAWLNTGITVIGKRAELPEGIKVGRNCKISADVKPDNFSGSELAGGQSIEVASGTRK
jgi:glucose-1-phosphate adenylyltransferase